MVLPVPWHTTAPSIGFLAGLPVLLPSTGSQGLCLSPGGVCHTRINWAGVAQSQGPGAEGGQVFQHCEAGAQDCHQGASSTQNE